MRRIFLVVSLLFSLVTFHSSPVQGVIVPKEVKPSLSAVAGENLALGDIVCIKSSDGKAYKASASNATLRPAVGYASTVARTGTSVRITTSGSFAGYNDLTVGQPVYLSATAGTYTQTATVGWYQQVGVAVTSTTIRVDIKAASSITTDDISNISIWLAGQLSGGTILLLNIGDGNATIDNFGNALFKSLGVDRGDWPQYVQLYEATSKGNKFRRIVAPLAGYTSGDNETEFALPEGNPTAGGGYMAMLWPSLGAGEITSQAEWKYGLYANTPFTGLVKTAGNQIAIAATAGTDYSVPSGVEALTNKTIDASATGNVLKQYKYINLTHPAWCDEGNATMQTTAANKGQYLQCKYSHDDNATNNYAIYQWQVPEDLDTTVDLAARWYYRLGGNDTNKHAYRMLVGRVDASEQADAPTFGNSVSFNCTADAAGVSGDLEICPAVASAMTTLTGWRSALTPGRLMLIKVGRQGADVTNDNSTTDSYSQQLVIRYQSTL